MSGRPSIRTSERPSVRTSERPGVRAYVRKVYRAQSIGNRRYMYNDEKTANTFDEEGFLRTGDVGKVVDGFTFITGRIKEMIINNKSQMI